MDELIEGFDWVLTTVNGVSMWLWKKVPVDLPELPSFDDVVETAKKPVKAVAKDLPDPQNLLEALTTILKELKELETQVATIITDVGEIPEELWKKFSTTIETLPSQIWTRLTLALGDLANKAWDLLPDDIKDIFTFLREQIDGVISFLTPLSAVPQRITGHLIGAGMTFLADAGAFLKQLVGVLQLAGLNKILPSSLTKEIEVFLSDIEANRPGWAGPEIAFEFGYFDVGEGGARALRLTLPPELGLAGFAAPLLASPIGTAFLPTLIALNASANLLYSMFPGYPAFHDMPVRSGILETDLPVGSDWSNGDDRFRAWPGSGYFFLPGKDNPFPLSQGNFCTVAINLKKIAQKELESLNAHIGAQAFFLAPGTGIESLLNNVLHLANETGSLVDKADSLGALLNVGMRVVQPLPFGPYPGRMANPLPIVIGEERHCRNFLLYQAVKNTDQGSFRTWQVMSLYHPLTSKLSHALDRDGVAGLYAAGSRPSGVAWKFGDKPESQTVFPDTFVTISPWNSGHSVVPGPASMERLDLSQGGPYSIYNWELFFHIPLLIAGRLARQQSFAEALAWYRQIFDPTVSKGDSPQRFWRFKQLHDDYADEQPYQRLIAWLRDLAEGTDDSERADVVAAWRRDPFNPHRVARMRAGAYARAVVMRTVETLVNWGDARFQGGSWEAVNEATQLYLLAREILGPRPQLVPARQAQPLTYRQLASDQGQSSIGIWDAPLS